MTGWIVHVSPGARRRRETTLWYVAVSDAAEACQKVKDVAKLSQNQKISLVRQLSDLEVSAYHLQPGQVKQTHTQAPRPLLRK